MIAAGRRPVRIANQMTVHGQQPRRVNRHDELVSEAERQHQGSRGFIRQFRPEPDPLRGDERRRDGHDDGIGHHRAERGFDRNAFSAMIDEHDGQLSRIGTLAACAAITVQYPSATRQLTPVSA
jgi:hypothetical protein